MAIDSELERDKAAVERLKAHSDLESITPEAISLVVDKSQRQLALRLGDRTLKHYTIIIGRNAAGHKQREGDERTPEGEYRICYRNGESRFHLFMGLNYPNGVDAQNALDTGVLDADKCAELTEAAQHGKRPDWYTPLGGEVGIHGGGTDRDGTAGCIALANQDVEEIWASTVVGTPVTIRP